MNIIDGVSHEKGMAVLDRAPSSGGAVTPAAPPKPSRKQQAKSDKEYRWRLFRDAQEATLRFIRAEMQRTWDADKLAILEQEEINILYKLDGAPRDPLQAPAEEL
jgi:hypothetical protein